MCPPITELSRQKIRLYLRRNTTRTTTTVHDDWSLFNNQEIRDKYALTLRNKLDAQQENREKHTSNDEYENFVNAHLEAATECIPTKQRAKRRVPLETLADRKKADRRENCLQMQQDEPNEYQCSET